MAVTTILQQRKDALASVSAAVADGIEDAAIDGQVKGDEPGQAAAATDAAQSSASAYEQALASVPNAKRTRLPVAKPKPPKVGTDGKKATTAAKGKSTKAKAKAPKAKTEPKARKLPDGLTVKGNPRTTAWVTAKGEDVTVGARVKAPWKGVVKARCTKPAKDDQPRVAMVGILLDDPSEHARGVKVPTVPAIEVVLAKK